MVDRFVDIIDRRLDELRGEAELPRESSLERFKLVLEVRDINALRFHKCEGG